MTETIKELVQDRIEHLKESLKTAKNREKQAQDWLQESKVFREDIENRLSDLRSEFKTLP